MPVFGTVPYRTEARTRSEARIQAEVDRLLEVLRTVANVMWTAEGRLLELLPNGMRHILRPPPVTSTFYFHTDPNIRFGEVPDRAAGRHYAQIAPMFSDWWRWGDMRLGQESQRYFTMTRGLDDNGVPLLSWGTLQ